MKFISLFVLFSICLSIGFTFTNCDSSLSGSGSDLDSSAGRTYKHTVCGQANYSRTGNRSIVINTGSKFYEVKSRHRILDGLIGLYQTNTVQTFSNICVFSNEEPVQAFSGLEFYMEAASFGNPLSTNHHGTQLNQMYDIQLCGNLKYLGENNCHVTLTISDRNYCILSRSRTLNGTLDLFQAEDNYPACVYSNAPAQFSSSHGNRLVLYTEAIAF